MTNTSSQKSPFFSIIIPVYNTEKYLRECLDSVLNQTFTDWEAICVDDGSTDGSADILDEYSKTDPRFCVIHQQNAGVSAARNIALDEAKGQWIVFLDADDQFAKERLLENFDLINKNPGLDCLRVGWRYMPSGNIESLERFDSYDGEIINAPNALDRGWRLVSRCSMPFLYCFRRDVIGNTRYPLGIRFREDALFTLELFSNISKLLISDFHSYLYYRVEGTASTFQRRDDSIRFLQKLICLWKSQRKSFKNFEYVQECFTFLALKDVKRWLSFCKDKKKEDIRAVCSLLREALFCRALNPFYASNGMQWFFFMFTGSLSAFSFNKKIVSRLFHKIFRR